MDPLDLAVAAAHAAGKLLRSSFGSPLNVDALEAHDIKLELDVQTQALITHMILDHFHDHAIFGEEGIAGNQSSPNQWIIDPIDGTVNFFYGIPHFCISIAMREQSELLIGVIYDPIRDELWQVRKGSQALLNGKPIAASKRTSVSDSILSVGFSKTRTSIDSGLPLFQDLVYRARKCRLMGSAALDMAYVATGRLDAYIEQSVSLWDVAAGILLVEAAGGSVKMETRPDTPEKFSVVATNGVLQL
ncbi:MAG TPA: inositol monophosphatase family protein [Steroidobacteraceae bacterium]|jgi:myo-inositol-1(or 4)-monophosphatase|nr:inositol monophosphatase family protein [Steroidobacteraceae bacterium]